MIGDASVVSADMYVCMYVCKKYFAVLALALPHLEPPCFQFRIMRWFLIAFCRCHSMSAVFWMFYFR